MTESHRQFRARETFPLSRRRPQAKGQAVKSAGRPTSPILPASAAVPGRLHSGSGPLLPRSYGVVLRSLSLSLRRLPSSAAGQKPQTAACAPHELAV